MNGHDERRQSSLPRSLIPHLYRHPPNRDSGTRTTLYDSDIPPSPPFALPSLPPPHRAAWSDGEPGPSSLANTRYRQRPASLSPLPDPFARPISDDLPFDQFVRRDADRDPYLVLQQSHQHTHTHHHTHHHHQQHQYHQPQPYYPQHAYHASDLVLPPEVDDSHFSFRHDSYPPYLSVANLSLHTPPPPPTHFRSPSSTDGGGGSGTYTYRSDSYTDNVPYRPLKRRRSESDTLHHHENTPRKQSTPRKTAVACNFCRGRKLRCNGAKPACSHCTARQINCEYVSTPKRRGPGKAPKGSRSKKAGASRLDPSGSASSSSNNNIITINATSGTNTADRPSSAVHHHPHHHQQHTPLQTPQLLPAYELAGQAPEMRPYTHVMALDSLDLFSFSPPAQAPRYPSGGGDPEMMMMRAREYYSRTRSPRRRETSSEDRSGAEWE